MDQDERFLPVGSVRVMWSEADPVLLLRIKAALSLLYPPPAPHWLLFPVHSFNWTEGWRGSRDVCLCRSASEQHEDEHELICPCWSADSKVGQPSFFDFTTKEESIHHRPIAIAIAIVPSHHRPIAIAIVPLRHRAIAPSPHCHRTITTTPSHQRPIARHHVPSSAITRHQAPSRAITPPHVKLNIITM